VHFKETDSSSDLQLDRYVHDQFIRLNHYTMHDEHFFHNVRLVRAKGIGISEDLVWKHYREFNEHKDETITHFIQQKHPDMFEKFWKPLCLVDENLPSKIDSE
jgi:hypothetical protein